MENNENNTSTTHAILAGLSKLNKTLDKKINKTVESSQNLLKDLTEKVENSKYDLSQGPDFLRNITPEKARAIMKELQEKPETAQKLLNDFHERVPVTREPVAVSPHKEVPEENTSVKAVSAPVPQAVVVKEDFRLTPEKKKQIRELPANIKTKIFGQDDVIDDVVAVLKTAFAGLSSNKKKPKGAYIFAGPSGCGKTETVIQLAEFLNVPIKKFSMTEFSEENDVKKLIGAPAGYVGYEDGGQLTNFVNANPNAIILFDEIEKADPSLSKILLGVLEDGKLTDGKGVEVNFTNTMFFATSNLGSEIEYSSQATKKEKDEYRMNSIKEFFPIEVINRFDSLIQFSAISKEVYSKIVTKVLNGLAKDFEETQGAKFEYDQAVVDFVVENSYDPAMGGRPAGRFMSKVLIKGVVDKIYEDDDSLSAVDCITLSINKTGNLVFKDGKKIIAEIKETQELLSKYNQTKLTKEEQQVRESALATQSHEQIPVTPPPLEITQKVSQTRKSRATILTELAQSSGNTVAQKITAERIKKKNSPKRA